MASTRTLSLSNEGGWRPSDSLTALRGTLHGIWSADTARVFLCSVLSAEVVSLSDRRFKREIRPLIKALPKARKRLALPLHLWLNMKRLAADFLKRDTQEAVKRLPLQKP